MATNPMQRQKRNSFLLGMLTMLLIASVIIVLLFMQLLNMKKKEKEEEASYRNAYILTSDVKSGELISLDNIQQIQVESKYTPTNLLTTEYIKEDTIAKIDLTKGTILGQEMVTSSGKTTTADLRKQEYNMINLPTQIVDGDYIDIRLRLPSGQDYIVVSKKNVTIPKIGGVDSEDTIILEMTEAEILTMSNAIVEAYIVKGSELYATTYVEPGIQNDATSTYPVSNEVMEQINNDPNIVKEAREALWARYNVNLRNNFVNKELNKHAEEAQSNVEAGIEEQITKQKELRKQYLDSLGAGTTVE